MYVELVLTLTEVQTCTKIYYYTCLVLYLLSFYFTLKCISVHFQFFIYKYLFVRVFKNDNKKTITQYFSGFYFKPFHLTNILHFTQFVALANRSKLYIIISSNFIKIIIS